MHEVSLMESVADLAISRARGVGASRIHQLQLEVGEFSGVVIEALEFAFEVVAVGTILEGATLAISSVRAACFCASCQTLFHPPDWTCECPVCSRLSADIRRGKTLELISIEVS